MSSATGQPSRREQQRADTQAEIKAVARELLNEAGPVGISLRAIARRMGMSAPALYRYFPSLEALVTDLCVDLYAELRAHMLADADTRPDGDMVGRLLAVARGFREWSVNNRPEFSLMFASLNEGSMITPPHAGRAVLDPEAEPYRSLVRFSRVFCDMFNRVLKQTPAERGYTLATPRIPPLTPELRAEVIECSQAMGLDAPIEYSYTFMSFWVRLYGLVTMEVFGQLPIVEQSAALLEAEIYVMAGQLGVDLAQVSDPSHHA
ncbi:TetR family transcriptional regulator [Stackebrandtia endophytica]|uniref:TetR family transcriptional regulator n=1 Tax=Stackebrandtia endophytica TaxID=1496996 RepID=A0A543B1L2_9ACTN|nr:TetR/AcrR family transcriptional regulator [Stackebrandtia endophytica]TQL78725.1 TetR family transcriptional regulator [Stackebrandtia endophytica]